MNHLADESVDRQIVDALREAGYKVTYVAETSSGISDTEVLQQANQSEAILITGDKDFGELVFRLKLNNYGVVLLRISGLSQSQKVAIAMDTFTDHSAEFSGSFSVITRNGVRVRRQR